MKKCPTCHIKHERKGAKYCSLKCSDRAWQLKRKYGITPDIVFEMYEQQEGRCAICRTRGDVRELGFVKRESLCVDHDHRTGEVRGLLCGFCNRGIGLLRDSQDILTSAKKYLNKNKRKANGKANKRRTHGTRATRRVVRRKTE